MALAAICVPAVASAQRLIFVVRHAERADAGMTAQTDPPLSAIGEARSSKLAGMLADAGVKDIFVTEFKRTQDTAKPLASGTFEQVGLPIGGVSFGTSTGPGSGGGGETMSLIFW